MKIRNGFVSNSSSSSFIVAFEKLPESVDETKQMLFGDDKTVYWNDEIESANVIAARVFDNIQATEHISQKTTKCEIICLLCNGTPYDGTDNYYGMGEHSTFSLEDYDTFLESIMAPIEEEIIEKYGQKWNRCTIQNNNNISDEEKKSLQGKIDKARDEANKAHQRAAKKALADWMKRHPSHTYYKIFHYSDNKGEGFLEHGGIFAALPHLRISHH